MITIEHAGITAKLVRPAPVPSGTPWACTHCVFNGSACDSMRGLMRFKCVQEKGGTYWVPIHQQTEGVQDA